MHTLTCFLHINLSHRDNNVQFIWWPYIWKRIQHTHMPAIRNAIISLDTVIHIWLYIVNGFDPRQASHSARVTVASRTTHTHAACKDLSILMTSIHVQYSHISTDLPIPYRFTALALGQWYDSGRETALNGLIFGRNGIYFISVSVTIACRFCHGHISVACRPR